MIVNLRLGESYILRLTEKGADIQRIRAGKKSQGVTMSLSRQEQLESERGLKTILKKWKLWFQGQGGGRSWFKYHIPHFSFQIFAFSWIDVSLFFAFSTISKALKIKKKIFFTTSIGEWISGVPHNVMPNIDFLCVHISK